MKAMSIVHMRVKRGREDEFHKLREHFDPAATAGMSNAWLVKTGDRAYCFITEWESVEAIVQAFPATMANVERMRDLLEDLGGGKGVTDPHWGPVVGALHDLKH